MLSHGNANVWLAVTQERGEVRGPGQVIPFVQVEVPALVVKVIPG